MITVICWYTNTHSIRRYIAESQNEIFHSSENLLFCFFGGENSPDKMRKNRIKIVKIKPIVYDAAVGILKQQQQPQQKKINQNCRRRDGISIRTIKTREKHATQ